MKSNKIQQTKKALLEALEKTMGIVTPACAKVGIDRSTFYKYIKEDDQFARDVKMVENAQKDFGETQLFKLIKNENPAAVIFYNKTKNKDRGYIERTEVINTEVKLPEWMKEGDVEGES